VKWKTPVGSFESREGTADERLALAWENGWITPEVLEALGFDRWPRPGSRAEAKAIRTLFVAGWPLPNIEDVFSLHEDEAEKLAAPVRDLAVRLLYLAGVPTPCICERTETHPARVSALTSDIARAPRGPGKSRNALSALVRESIRTRWSAGQCGLLIRRELGISHTTLRTHTRDLPRRQHRCPHCRPGPKPIFSGL
jgi:hypothetical protein